MARLLDSGAGRIDHSAVRLDLRIVECRSRTGNVGPVVFDIDFDPQRLPASIAADAELGMKMRIGLTVLVAERSAHPPLAHQRPR